MMEPRRSTIWGLASAAALLCHIVAASPQTADDSAAADGHSAPTAATVAANAAAARALPPSTAEADADRGLVAREEPLVIQGADGEVIWDSRAYDFVDGEAPASVHPGLWRQAKLNRRHGLYKVTEGVYQVRGYDLSNMSVVVGERGYVVVDPLTAEETARAAMALVTRELGARPVTAIVFTHSHVDHFGGVFGVVSPDELAKGATRVVAPADFLHQATSENVLAGTVMGRRAEHMFGRALPRSPRGHVDSGLGHEPAIGRMTIATPTDVVNATPTELLLDGVRFVFQHVPESEAPAELTFYLPDHRAFCGAEIVSHTLHNLYTLRGAQVRDALRWSGYLDQALELFGAEAEVLFQSHHWPTWGNAAVRGALAKQRDVYRYIHDQTLRLASAGLTPREIAEELRLPRSLRETPAVGGYYGTVRHNAKAVYQRYFGWFDGNAANLDPHPPEEAARRYVDFMGGVDEVVRKARASFEEGDYRWVATVLDHVIFARPDHAAARELLARAYDQLGYRAESGPWRDVYLSAAYELRHGRPDHPPILAGAAELLARTPTERFLEALAIRLDGPAADGVELTIDLILADAGESWRLWIENAVLHHRRRPPDPAADSGADPAADSEADLATDVTLEVSRPLFLALLTGRADALTLVRTGQVRVDGDASALTRFLALLRAPDPAFAIVTP